MVQDSTNSISFELKKVDEKIRNILFENNNFLTENFIDFILNGSKKIRSAVAILSVKSFGYDVSDAQTTICALGEIIHNASLIHDDIVDKSDVRRGKPSLNSTLGNSIAVLGGDFLISVVLKELLKFNNYNVLRRFSNMFLTLCDGEINQLGEKNQLVSIEKYLEKSEKKTAELFKTILFSVFAVDDLQKHFDFAEKFGKNFGLAFQIRDDVLNYCSKSTDKPVLSDYENGICTLPIIFYAEEKNIEDFCKIKISEVQNSSAVGKSIEVCEKFANIALDLTADFSDNQYADALKNLCQDLKRI